MKLLIQKVPQSPCSTELEQLSSFDVKDIKAKNGDSGFSESSFLVQDWNPRSLSSFQTFPRSSHSTAVTAGASETAVRLGDRGRHAHSRSAIEPMDNNVVRTTSQKPNFQHQDSNDIHDLQLFLSNKDKRFGFSVSGGIDEGFNPRIDAITPGSPADRADLEVGDEILEVNGKSLECCTHTEVISHIHQHSNVQDAFVIAVEQQARDRLEKLSALKKIKPVDMTKLSQQLAGNSDKKEVNVELNGLIESSPIYNISVPELRNSQTCLSSSALEGKAIIRETSSNFDVDKPKAELNSLNSKQPLSRENSDKSRNYSSCSNLSNGNGGDLDNSRGEELELKQEIPSGESEEESTDKDPHPIPSTEVLLGTVNQMVIAQDVEPWKKDRESLSSRHSESTASNRSSLKGSVRDPKTPPLKQSNEDSASGKSYSSKENLSSLYSDYKNIVMEIDSGPHREVAVDVPDTFIARTKTPPRYPPPKSYNSLQSRNKNSQNGSISKTIANSRDSNSALTRESQITNNNVKNIYSSSSDLQTKHTGSLNKDDRKYIVSGVKVLPTNVPERETETVTDKGQLERIKKYQEDIRKRKQEEINKAKEEEILRNSLRNSKKLLALEQSSSLYSSGVENSAFSIEDETHHVPVVRKTISLNELVDSLNKIYLHLPSLSHEVEESHLDEVENLLMKEDFVKVLKIHNKIIEHWCMQTAPVPVCNNSTDVAQESLKTLRESSVPDVVELVDILNKFQMVGLLYAHDKIADRCLIPAISPETEILQRVHQYAEEKIKVVTLEKTHEPLGATVRNEGDAVIIGRIVKGGAADKSGKLHEGDEILEVNTIEMRGKNVNEVCDILAGMTGTLVFLIVPACPETTQPLTLPNHEVVMHVKAHFDYDPEDDQYIPCRELGISFQKGDILHVIKQDDPNWWQAYREGEEDQSLAGLIPSMNFQQQRETLKQTIVESTESKEKSRKGKLLCAKRQQKKKKKKFLYSGSYSEDCEDVLTYEEVALYYPSVNQKRPIVLIGPPNIGRHELRQKLMERGIDRFAAAVPHTSRSKRDGDEVDGQDYHFISRVQFEADIQSRKFVEHGEYEKAYYGTSLEAIRSVVKSGKICVLNLHPQSLKILKSSDLKPFVVFIAPPNLEVMRRNKDIMGANVKDEELKDIIEKAREIEENYGHYFDLTLINMDIEKTYSQLLREINFLEREPQWVPISWLPQD